MSYAIQKLAVCQKVAEVVNVTSSEGFSSFCTYVGVTCSPKHGHILDNSPTLNVNVFMDGMENMNCLFEQYDEHQYSCTLRYTMQCDFKCRNTCANYLYLKVIKQFLFNVNMFRIENYALSLLAYCSVLYIQCLLVQTLNTA